MYRAGCRVQGVGFVVPVGGDVGELVRILQPLCVRHHISLIGG